MTEIQGSTANELASLLLGEQRLRWLCGDHVFVEHFLDEHPNLAQHQDVLLDLIYQEQCLRMESGEEITLEEYDERFSTLKEPIRAFMEVHAAIYSEELDKSLTELAASLDGVDTLLDSQTALGVITNPLPAVGSTFGEYEILEHVGAGAMGVVFKARQTSLDRIVAIKMVRTNRFSSTEAEKLHGEAINAAQLQHPNIVSIHHVGEAEGQHFFTMDFVEHGTLRDRMVERTLTTNEAVDCLIDITKAVIHAHQRDILHRDLKPANILIDEHGQPQITDFGLASRVSNDEDNSSSMVGSPGYMPPEQINRDVGRITERSDVFSLGAILYDMLTGRPPFRAGSIMETLHQTLETQEVTVRAANPAIDKDLETICHKCLQKQPSRRYENAVSLLTDLELYRKGEPILARPISRGELWWRYCRRQPLLASLIAVSTLLVLGIAIASPIVALREGHLRSEAQEQRKVADAAREQAERELRVSTVHRLITSARLELADHPQRALLLGLEAAKLSPSKMDDNEMFPVVEQFLRTATMRVGGTRLTGFEGDIRTTAIDEMGNWFVATGREDFELTCWRIGPTVEPKPRILSHDAGEVSALAFVPNSFRFLTTHWNGQILLWDSRTSAPQDSTNIEGSIYELAFNRDGSEFAVGSDTKIHVFRTNDLTPQREIAMESRVTRLEYGVHDFLAASTIDGRFKIWSDDASEPVFCSKSEDRHQFLLSRDGQTIARFGTYSPDGDQQTQIVVHRISSTAPPTTRSILIEGDVGLVRLSPKGSWLFWVDDAGAHLLDPSREAAEQSTIDIPIDYQVENACFGVDGSRLVTYASRFDDDAILSSWQLRSNTEPQLKESVPCGPNLSHLSISSDNQSVFCATGSRAMMWDPTSNQLLELRGNEGEVNSITTCDGSRFVVLDEHAVRVWNQSDPFGTDSCRNFEGETLLAPTISPDSKQLAYLSQDSMATVSLDDAEAPAFRELADSRFSHLAFLSSTQLVAFEESGNVVLYPEDAVEAAGKLAHDSKVRQAAVSQDGTHLMTAEEDGETHIWNLENLTKETVQTRPRGVSAIAIHNENNFATAGYDGEISWWRGGADQAPLASRIEAHVGAVFLLGFDEAGQTLLSAGADGVARLWNHEGDPPTALHAELSDLDLTVVRDDNRQFATTSFDGVARIWDFDKPQIPRREIQALPGAFHTIALGQNGKLLSGGSRDGTVRVWHLDTQDPTPILIPLKLGTAITSLEFSGDKLVVSLEDGTCNVLDFGLTRLRTVANRVAGRSLTSEERRSHGLAPTKTND